MLVENFSYVTPVAIRSAPQRRYDAWLKLAFREIYRVLRANRFCVSFYSWKKADKFLAAWREAGFRTAGHPTFVEVRLNRALPSLPARERLLAGEGQSNETELHNTGRFGVEIHRQQSSPDSEAGIHLDAFGRVLLCAW